MALFSDLPCATWDLSVHRGFCGKTKVFQVQCMFKEWKSCFEEKGKERSWTVSQRGEMESCAHTALFQAPLLLCRSALVWYFHGRIGWWRCCSASGAMSCWNTQEILEQIFYPGCSLPKQMLMNLPVLLMAATCCWAWAAWVALWCSRNHFSWYLSI